MRSWDFDHTNLSEDQLIGLVVAMFDQLGLIHTFGISTEKLYRFVAEVSKHYHRDVIYHNFRHAFDVTHALYYYLTEGGVMEMEAYSPLDAFTNIIAALCHDINHQGVCLFCGSACACFAFFFLLLCLLFAMFSVPACGLFFDFLSNAMFCLVSVCTCCIVH